MDVLPARGGVDFAQDWATFDWSTMAVILLSGAAFGLLALHIQRRWVKPKHWHGLAATTLLGIYIAWSFAGAILIGSLPGGERQEQKQVEYVLSAYGSESPVLDRWKTAQLKDGQYYRFSLAFAAVREQDKITIVYRLDDDFLASYEERF